MTPKDTLGADTCTVSKPRLRIWFKHNSCPFSILYNCNDLGIIRKQQFNPAEKQEETSFFPKLLLIYKQILIFLSQNTE